MKDLEKLLGAKEEQIKELISKISTPKVKKVIELKYGLKDGNIKTLKEVAEEMNITMELARQYESRGIRFLKANLPNNSLFGKIKSIFKK